jgi:hypothetical protein
MQTTAAWAEGLARALLADSLPRRWSHVQGVAARARTLKPSLGADANLIEAAAWLHDIGYLPELAGTGLHGLDGARYLRDVQHAEPLLCRLVAHHSCAVIEAEERGLAHVLTREFTPPPRLLADALTFCDMTTSPDGAHVHVHNRLAEIHDRYPGSSLGCVRPVFVDEADPAVYLRVTGEVLSRPGMPIEIMPSWLRSHRSRWISGRRACLKTGLMVSG